MPEIVRQRDRFRQILVQRQRARDRPANGRHLDRMRQPRAQVIARAIEEDLRLVFQPAESARMNDPRPVALKLRPISVTSFGKSPPPRVARFLRERREHAAFVRLHRFTRFPTPAHNRGVM